MEFTKREYQQFYHGISMSLLSKKSAQKWRYDDETAEEIRFLEGLESKVLDKIRQADTPQTETQNSNKNSNVISVYDGVSEAVRCAMCSNPNKSDRGCDGACSYDEKLYERLMKAFAESIAEDEPQTCSVNGRPYDCGKCEYFRCTADEPQTERSGE